MEFDKTRKAIGTDKLASKDRKEIMQKLAGAGGQVLNEKSIRQAPSDPQGGAGNSGGRKAGGGGVDVRLPSEIAREKNRLAQEKAAQARQMRESEDREARSFLNRFFIKLGCMSRGVTPFGSDMVKPGFLSLLNLDAKRALMECQILGNDLFANNRQTAIKIVKELDAKNPLLVELMERATSLYNRGELGDLTGSYTPGSRKPVALDSIRPGIFSLLRKLYYLRPYAETYTIAAEMAIDIQQSIEKKHAGLYTAKKKKIRQEWRILMDSIYPGLVLLAQRAEMKRAESGSRLFEEMIGVLEEDRIGKRKPGDPVGAVPDEKKTTEDAGAADETAADAESDESDAEQSAKPEIPRELEFGYKIMRIYPLAALRKKHDNKDEFKSFSERDKVFLSMLFFREFEEEYSFILTTPKIEFEIQYQGGAKIDYHQKLSDLFQESRMVEDAFKNYQHATLELRKASDDTHKAANYVEQSKKMEKLEGKAGNAGQEARTQLLDYSEKIIDIFKILIDDMRSDGTIILNKDKPINFDLERDKRKRLHGKAVKDAIMQAYCYLLALTERLRNGDLYGGVIEMSPEEFAEAFQSPATPN
ncbi:MAG: hypothetical protein KDK39_11515 [Leptospiraceae bacterium]|nr:hypothetical protein [Leptospiraceae bacterium]